MRRIIALLVFTLCAALPASLHAATDAERIEMLEKQLEAQRRLLDSLQSELEQLKRGQPTLAVDVIPEEDRADAESELITLETEQEELQEGPQLELYGHFQIDSIYDFKRVDPTWESTLRPSTIPTTDDVFGTDGNTIISVKQTQFGMKAHTTTPLGLLHGWFEFDFFGTGTDAGDTKFNLRHAWAEIGSFGFGQTNSVFTDVSVFPNVVDWWGPSGWVFNRNAQLRYTWLAEASEFAVALEKPNGSFNSGIFGELSPEFDEDVRAKTKYPDLTAHWRQEFDFGHYQVAGVIRHLEFETPGFPESRPRGVENGWGINLTGSLNSIGNDKLKLGLVYGEGIASFMNDGGVNLAPHNNEADAVPVLGIIAYYDRYWSPRWSSSIGFSINDADVRNQQSADEFDKGVYASANLLYTPYPEFLIGTEFLYGEHKDVGGRVGEDYRVQFTVKHKLGTSF